MKIDALLWDYDGAIVNSVPKNIAITKEIIAEVAVTYSGANPMEWEHRPDRVVGTPGELLSIIG